MRKKANLVQGIRHIVRKTIEFFAKIYSYLPVSLRKTFLYYYKRITFPQEEKCVLFVFDSHWNTIDSFLPALYWLKERMGYRILSFWGVENQHRFLQGNEVYFDMLANVSDVVVLNGFSSTNFTDQTNRLKRMLDLPKEIFYSTLMLFGYSRECKAIFKKYNVCSVLRLDDKDLRIWSWIYECFPLVKHITHPHTGFMGMFRLPDDIWLELYKSNVDIVAWTDASCFKGPECGLYEMFRKRCVVVGSPKYDKWWLKKIISLDYRLKSFQKMILEKKAKKIIICFGLLDILTSLSSQEPGVSFQELNELKQFLDEYNDFDVFYILKFHPSTNILCCDYGLDFDGFLYKFFPKGRFEYLITSLPLAPIADSADLVIAVGLSTVAIDAAVTGTPTIEFHEKRKSEYWYKCPDGTYGSFLKLHQLALYASNAEELSYWVNLVLEGKVSWDKYYEKLQGYIMLDGNASKRVGDVVQQYAQPSV